MSRTSSSHHLVKIPINGLPIRLIEKAKELETMRQAGIIRMIASVEKLTSLESIDKLPPRIHAQQQTVQQSYKYPPEVEPFPAPTCPIDPPTFDAFAVKQFKGKLVRDVWVDTHDLINEPGGYVINLSRHGGTSGTSTVKSLRIHLGIRPSPVEDGVQLVSPKFSAATITSAGDEVIGPGTITSTDDYAREIFLGIQSHPELLSLYAILEIKETEDFYHQKTYQELGCPGFLPQFIRTLPTALTKFRVEMPGLSGVYLPEWKFLLDQQTSLQELICNFGVIMWHFYERTVQRNSRTLQRIVLRRLQTFDVTTSKYTPMNWGIFSDCRSLTYLKITCGYKTTPEQVLTTLCPPGHVFLHENMDALPQHNSMEELHLGKIWVEPCQLKQFCERRPRLKVCLDCNDQEYYDEDLPTLSPPLIVLHEQKGHPLSNELRYLQVSRFNLSAEIPAIGSGSLQKVHNRKQHTEGSLPDEVPDNPGSQSAQKRYGRVVLILFITILVALTILFIIIFFRHLRGGSNNNANYNDHEGDTGLNITLDERGKIANITVIRRRTS